MIIEEELVANIKNFLEYFANGNSEDPVDLYIWREANNLLLEINNL